MSQRTPSKSASDSRDFLQAATSVAWVGAYARLTEPQITKLLGCFKKPLIVAAASQFSTFAAIMFLRAQVLQQASAGLSSPDSKGRDTKPRRNASTHVRNELHQLRAQIGVLKKRLAKTSDNAIHAVDHSLGGEERMMFWPPLAEEQGMKVLFRRAHDALSDLELAIGAVQISVRRGRRNDATHMIVEALAHLYRDVAGRKPKRNYRDGETGEFLKLAQTFMRMVRAALPPAVRSHVSPSLSKVVREVMAEQRT